MKKKEKCSIPIRILILQIIVFFITVILITQETSLNFLKNTKLQNKPLISQNKDIFISQPLENQLIERGFFLNGVTSNHNLKIEIKDNKNNILNKDDMDIELFDENNNLLEKDKEYNNKWKSFNKYIYLFQEPTTEKGKIKIYSDKNNFVEVPITFTSRLEKKEKIKVLYPKKNKEYKDYVDIMGFSSVYNGKVYYKVIDDKNNIIQKEKEIDSTSPEPSIGIFATRFIPQTLVNNMIIEIYSKNPVSSKEEFIIKIPIKYMK